MRVETKPAANVRFEELLSTSENYPYSLRIPAAEDTSDSVKKFIASKPPEELVIAAKSIWGRVSQYSHEELFSFFLNNKKEATSTSPGGWMMHIIRNIPPEKPVEHNIFGGSLKSRQPGPINLGFAFTRMRLQIPNKPIELREASIQPHTDAYVWIDPEHRGKQVASIALKYLDASTTQLGYKRRAMDKFQYPFPIDRNNSAANKLLDKFLEPDAERFYSNQPDVQLALVS